MSNGHRWSKFWWQDWQGDKALRTVSLAARGLWMELLCIAHEGSPIGHVTLNGRTPTHRQLGSIVGVSEKEIEKLLRELDAAGVFSRADDGTIFCRRMVRDAARSDEGKQHISKRWGPDGGSTPNRSPSSPPTAPPTRSPNGLAHSPPDRAPITLEAEAESEDRKGRKKGSLRSPRAPASPPEGWHVSAVQLAFGISLGLAPEAIELAAERMLDWARGSGHRRTDWDAVFRNWLRSDATRPPRHGVGLDPIGTLRREWNLPSFLAPNFDDDERDVPPDRRLQ